MVIIIIIIVIVIDIYIYYIVISYYHHVLLFVFFPFFFHLFLMVHLVPTPGRPHELLMLADHPAQWSDALAGRFFRQPEPLGVFFFCFIGKTRENQW
jgi:hypothetical protein